MQEFFVELFHNFPTWLATLLIATLPVGELRASVPIAVLVYEMHWAFSFLFSIIGNMIPVVLILLLFEPITNFLIKKINIFRRFFDWFFKFTRKRHSDKFEKWGALALILLVAIPLPMTGGYTGALAAYLFGIPFKKALPLIFIGVLIAGVIVTLFSMGIFNFI